MSNLCKNLEIALAEADSTLTKIGSLSTNILLPDRVICILGSLGRSREFGFEVIKAGLSGADIGQEIEIVVEEIFILISKMHNSHFAIHTELSDVCQPLHIGLVQDFEFFSIQASLCVIFPSHLRLIAGLIWLLTRNRSLALGRGLDSLPRGRGGIFLSLLPQRAIRSYC